MSLATQSLLKPLGIATNGCVISVPPFVATVKVSYSQARPSICIKPIKFQLSCSYASSVPSLFTLKKKDPILRVSIVAAQGEDSPAVLEEEQGILGNFNWGGSENDVEGGDTEGYAEPPEEAKVYVGNLPYDVDSEKLAGLFQEAGVVEISEVIYDRETDRSRGFGFVTMSTVEEADKAVGMFSRYDLNGRQLTVNKAAPKGARAERPPRVVESNPKIYVGNLAWSMDDSALERVFSEYGQVLSARVVSDRESGRSRGFGFVVMSNESEMNDAIAKLDGQSFDGRQIKVNVAEEKPRRPRF